MGVGMVPPAFESMTMVAQRRSAYAVLAAESSTRMASGSASGTPINSNPFRMPGWDRPWSRPSQRDLVRCPERAGRAASRLDPRHRRDQRAPGATLADAPLKSIYSVMAPAGAAPSHVGRHETSLARHWVTTHVAIDRQTGSVGQFVALPQQFAATQETHVVETMEFVSPNIWLTPGHAPASWSAATPAPIDGCPPSPCDELCPAETELAHGNPLVASQVPSSEGLAVLEHAVIAYAAHRGASQATTGDARSSRVLFDITRPIASNGRADPRERGSTSADLSQDVSAGGCCACQRIARTQRLRREVRSVDQARVPQATLWSTTTPSATTAWATTSSPSPHAIRPRPSPASADAKGLLRNREHNGLSNQRRNLRVVPILNRPLDEAPHMTFRIDERMLGQLRRALHA